MKEGGVVGRIEYLLFGGVSNKNEGWEGLFEVRDVRVWWGEMGFFGRLDFGGFLSFLI